MRLPRAMPFLPQLIGNPLLDYAALAEVRVGAFMQHAALVNVNWDSYF